MPMGKGSRNEREARDLYEAAGYQVYRPATVRFGENDLFNLFDLVAMHPDRVPRYVQVKSNRASGINQWCDDVRALCPPEHTVPEFVVKHDREGWRVIQPTTDGHETMLDGRETSGKIGEPLTAWLEGQA